MLRKVYSRLLGPAALRELQVLPASVVRQVLDEVPLTRSEYARLRSEHKRAKGRLKDMIGRFGLSSESIEKQRPALFRDLEHLCGRCAASRRCSDAGKAGASAGECGSFCPNASTLRKLAGQVSS